jgi:hypothetical protein
MNAATAATQVRHIMQNLMVIIALSFTTSSYGQSKPENYGFRHFQTIYTR